MGMGFPNQLPNHQLLNLRRATPIHRDAGVVFSSQSHCPQNFTPPNDQIIALLFDRNLAYQHSSFLIYIKQPECFSNSRDVSI